MPPTDSSSSVNVTNLSASSGLALAQAKQDLVDAQKAYSEANSIAVAAVLAVMNTAFVVGSPEYKALEQAQETAVAAKNIAKADLEAKTRALEDIINKAAADAEAAKVAAAAPISSTPITATATATATSDTLTPIATRNTEIITVPAAAPGGSTPPDTTIPEPTTNETQTSTANSTSAVAVPPVSKAPTSVLASAITGGSSPAQTSITQQTSLETPSLIADMNQSKADSTATVDPNVLAAVKQNKTIDVGSIIVDASLDYKLGNKNPIQAQKMSIIKSSSTRRSFIPIIIKTDFKYNLGTAAGSSNVPLPIYIIFDSTPDDISFSKSANWSPTNFLGRPEPVFTYQNSSPTTFNLVGKFYTETMEAHGQLLKLSDYIMSLVTPSEANYMPSPVTVFIGEWKQLRCIVTNISIKYTGPWKVNVSSADAAGAGGGAEAESVQMGLSSSNIPSHAPYYFEATFQFTVVGKDNEVKYAEQVILTTSNNSDPLNDGDQENILAAFNQRQGIGQSGPVKENTGLYQVSTSTQYTYSGGQIARQVRSNLAFATAANNSTAYSNANAVNRGSDQGVISNSIDSLMASASSTELSNFINTQIPMPNSGLVSASNLSSLTAPASPSVTSGFSPLNSFGKI